MNGQITNILVHDHNQSVILYKASSISGKLVLQTNIREEMICEDDKINYYALCKGNTLADPVSKPLVLVADIVCVDDIVVSILFDRVCF